MYLDCIRNVNLTTMQYNSINYLSARAINLLIDLRTRSVFTIYFVIFLIFAPAFFSLLLIPSIEANGSGETIEIRVGVYENPPKAMKDYKNEYIGIFPDLIKIIAQRENFKITWVEGTWIECLNRLSAGEIDVMIDVAYTQERAELYDFNSESVFTNWGVVYQKQGTEKIFNYIQLNNTKVAVMKSSAHYNEQGGILEIAQQNNLSIQFIEFQNYDEVFASIRNGSAEYGVVNRIFGLLKQKEYSVVPSGIYFNPIELKFAFPKLAPKNLILIPRIDNNLIMMKSDSSSEYYKILEKYLPNPDAPIIPVWVFVAIVGTVSTAVLLAIANVQLKKVISRKSQEILDKEIKIKEKELLIEKNELIQKLARGISHDFNNILTILNLNFEALKLEREQYYKEQAEFKIIESSILAARNLTRKLKILSTNIELQKSKVDLIEIIRNALELAIGRCPCRYEIEYDLSPIEIMADPVQMHEVFFNLALNAVQAMENGGTITVLITKELNQERQWIKILFKDTGSGIPQDILPRIFEPYFTTKKGGSGIGLALTQAIIKLHGGTIDCESILNVGTTFVIKLPLF